MAKGATLFVVVPKLAELDRRESARFHKDASGRMVDEEERPDLAYCREKCAIAVPPGRKLAGCHDALTTEDLAKTLTIDPRALMVCEIR